ncbi:Release factor glutamine methyltransferase [Phytophthora cinnamomi]|uniref:Release factor glutamine methyltransferase n=1 Tax=Phytophthora cinnamomi TaxID=4785 RepID=UPI00355A2116|nr:Release factor glutamine methyltransferase [Phytophthora cinnamomi]
MQRIFGLRRHSSALCRRIHSQQIVLEAVQEARERLSYVTGALAGPTVHDSARNEANALVANALQPRLASSSDVFFHGERQLTEHEAETLSFTLERRAAGEPLAYVLGRKEFWSLEFAVTKDTLIPRSDSEVLIETLVEQFHPQTPLRILDIGTGSGCLLLSALSEFPCATGIGIDISPGALAVAKQNARSNNLDGRAEFLLRDLQTLPTLRGDVADDELLYRRFDVILCNPPYIPSRELPLVGADVLEYEPHLALFSDGGSAVGDAGEDPEGFAHVPPSV